MHEIGLKLWVVLSVAVTILDISEYTTKRRKRLRFGLMVHLGPACWLSVYDRYWHQIWTSGRVGVNIRLICCH
jgi:hypothetical protein